VASYGIALTLIFVKIDQQVQNLKRGTQTRLRCHKHALSLWRRKNASNYNAIDNLITEDVIGEQHNLSAGSRNYKHQYREAAI
jgi:hypothetical protein